LATYNYKNDNTNLNKYEDSTSKTGKQTNETIVDEHTDRVEAGKRTDTSDTSTKTNAAADAAYNDATKRTATLLTDPTKLGYSAEQFDPDTLLALYNQAAKTKYDNAQAEYDQAINQYGLGLKNAQDSYISAMRQANANAIASGAARGTQAANELSTMLGLQQNGVAGATELAQKRANLGLEYAQALADAQVNSEDTSYNRRRAAIDQLLQKYVADDDLLGMLYYGGLGNYLTGNTTESGKNVTGEQTTKNITGRQKTTENLGGRTDTVTYK
jgi:hypothetical protein